MGIGSIVSFIMGMGLVYWIRRRKFNRRNLAGVEEFQNFEQATFIRLAEGIGRILGYFLIISPLAYSCFIKPSMDRVKAKTELQQQTPKH